MTDQKETVKLFLQNLREKYNNLSENIDQEIKKEYVEFSGTMGERELLEKEILVLSRALYYPNGDPVMKKRALTILSHVNSVVAFKQLEEYYQFADPEWKKWAAKALWECKTLLEKTLA